MPIYAQLETGALTDAKLLGAGPLGFAMWAKGLLYAKEHLTDGDIPREALPLLGLGMPDPEIVAASLVAVGLWRVTPRGWTIGPEKWARHQTTKAEVEAKREANNERQKRYREARQKGDNADVAEVSRVTNASSNAPRNTTPKPEPKPKPITDTHTPRATAEADPSEPDLPEETGPDPRLVTSAVDQWHRYLREKWEEFPDSADVKYDAETLRQFCREHAGTKPADHVAYSIQRKAKTLQPKFPKLAPPTFTNGKSLPQSEHPVVSVDFVTRSEPDGPDSVRMWEETPDGKPFDRLAWYRARGLNPPPEVVRKAKGVGE